MTEFEKAEAKVEKYTRKLAKAQFRLGKMYYSGRMVEEDFAEAVKWFTKAAELGNADAQYYLGDRYYLGEGVKRDHDMALRWYKKAAEQGHEDAQYWFNVINNGG